jgi:cell division protein FtsI (penicillin-binding protein 3)
MRDDELQVLGEPRKLNKREKWKIAIIAAVLLSLVVAVGMWIHKAVAPEQHEIIKSGKKMGEPTIILELQTAVDSLLTAQMIKIGNCLQGQVIIMDVETGEILAMSGQERNFEGKFQPCKNFAYQQELGSLMHTVSLLATLETGEAKLSDVVHTGVGVWPVEDGYEMKDHNWQHGGYGSITLDRALEVNSNIGISKVVSKVFGNNSQAFFDQLDKMSFGQPEHIEGIEGLQPTSYNSPKDKDWKNYNIWWSAIGYNRKIAPIQMLTFYNAIANDGQMVKPTLKTGEIEIINPQIASKANIDSMQVVLEHVVSQGLGRKAGTPLFQVAGKQGTSQVGEYDMGEDIYVNEYQVSFCGYFPADFPKFSMIVSINKLGLPASGGGMAGTLFYYITEWMVTHDIFPLLVEDEKTNDTIRITPQNVDSIIESMRK